MLKDDELPVEKRSEINEDEVDGQQDALTITTRNRATATFGPSSDTRDDLDWSSGGDDDCSAHFMG